MLSVENPLPDPTCSCEISQLKSSRDERASDHDKLALEEVDLMKSSLDDNYPLLPKFSMRDYVLSARSKDIKTNWPFSPKNLQICLNHGVTDLLPPFQHLDSMRNQSRKRCAVESSSLHKENINIPDSETSMPSNNLGSETSVDAGCSQKLAMDCGHMNSSASEGDKEFPWTPTTQSQPEIYSVPTNRSPYFELETDTISESSEAKVEAAVPPASHKIDSTVRPPFKKCRLIFKSSSSVAGPSSNEDSTPNSFVVSETMTSKVCPVCKTFASSSNTTLNAHIDQCLSGESTIKWAANSNVIKYRIKPRKARLMVDIYETAPHCTLEELDRRNGTSWAMNSNFPAQEIELCAGEEEQKKSPVNFGDTGNEGAVYIDANGTKFRILSKFSNSRCPKPLKGGNETKFLSTKKKNHRVQKDHKFLKIPAHNKAFGTAKPRCSSEVRCGQGINCVAKEGHAQGGRPTQYCFKPQEQIKLDDLGIIGHWVGCKRSCLTKKISGEDDHQHSRYNVTQDVLVDGTKSPLRNSYLERNCVLKTPILSENLISSPVCNKNTEMLSYEPRIDEYGEQPPPRKKGEFSSLRSRVGGDGKRYRILPKENVKRLRKDGISLRDGCKDHQSRKFSSLTKNLLSVGQASVPECKSNFKRKYSAPKKSEVHCVSELDKYGVAWPSQVDQQHDLIQNDTEKQSLGRPCVLKIRKKRNVVKISGKEEAMDLKNPPLAPQRHGHDVGEIIDSSVRVVSGLADTLDDGEPVIKEVQTHQKNNVTEPAARTTVAGSFMNLRKYDSMCGIEVFKRPLCGAETPFFPSEGSFGEIGGVVIEENTRMVTELDFKDGLGNYLPDVDPILIPGPPGSYLPSPRDMGADDLQGNSSLTTSRVLQSSEDNCDLVDRDSSNSPISATSTISSSSGARSYLKSSELSVGPHAVKDEFRSGFTGANVDPLVKNSVSAPLDGNIGPEKINEEDLRANGVVTEKGPLSFKNDWPSCCSQKEAGSQGFVLNYQDSQLLRRRSTASVPLAAIDKQIICDPNTRHNSLSSSSEPFSLSNYRNSGTEKVAVPAMKSPAGHVPMKVSADSEVKFSIGSDCNSASPSVSNIPVLRLMGKNLMVINKDENVSPKLRQVLSRTINDLTKPQFCTVSRASPGNITKEGYPSVQHVVPRGPFVFSQIPHNILLKPFDARLSNSYGSHIDFKMPQTTSQVSDVMFPTKNGASCFAASSEGHKYKAGSNLNPLRYSSEFFLANPAYQNRNAECASRHVKEIIIIDETPENEANLASDATTCNAGMVKVWGSSEYTPMPLSTYGYQSRLSSPCAGSKVDNAGFQMLPCRGMNAGPVRRNSTPEGTGILHPTSLTSSSSSAGHQRSA